MTTHLTGTPVETFMDALRSAKQGVLMLDFDGTLAPFAVNRMEVQVYEPVLELLQRIVQETPSRVVLISGRRASEVKQLAAGLSGLEIWGSHGAERILRDGRYEATPASEQIDRVLDRAYAALARKGLGSQLERKVGSVAIHWRGFTEKRQSDIRESALNEWIQFSSWPQFRVLDFDGGLELHGMACDKGIAVRTVLEDSPVGSPAAYLGDDVTDEAAFQAISERGLGILVRPEPRPTAAQVWLKPPEELFQFLQRWFFAVGGAQ